MFISRFLNVTSFNIFWGLIGALIALAWVRFLLEPKRSAAAVGMSRTRALRTLILFSLGWYIVWGTARGVMSLMSGPPVHP